MVARSRSMKRSMKRGRGRSASRGRMGGQTPCQGCPPFKGGKRSRGRGRMGGQTWLMGGRSRGRGRMGGQQVTPGRHTYYGGMAESPEHRGSPEAVYASRQMGQPLMKPMFGDPNPPPRGGSR